MLNWARTRAIRAAVLAATLGASFGTPRTARAAPILEHAVLLTSRGVVTVSVPELGTVRVSELTDLPDGVPLNLAEGARASGLCPDLSPFSLSGPTSATPPCPATPSNRGLSPLAPLRAFVPPVVPQLVFPRATWLRRLDFIEWRPVPDRERYRVELLDEQSRVVWSATAEHSHRIAYPAAGPALEPGLVYSVRVRAGDDSSESERAELGFRMLSLRGQAEVAAAERELSRLKLSQRAARWLRALALRRFQLRGEAAEQLLGVHEPPFLLELGNTYVALGLEQRAVLALSRVYALAARDSYESARAAAWLRQLGFEKETRR